MILFQNKIRGGSLKTSILHQVFKSTASCGFLPIVDVATVRFTARTCLICLNSFTSFACIEPYGMCRCFPELDSTWEPVSAGSGADAVLACSAPDTTERQAFRGRQSILCIALATVAEGADVFMVELMCPT